MLEHFSSLPDYRIDHHKLYPLPEMLLSVVCAVLSGAEGWEAMEEFGKAKHEAGVLFRASILSRVSTVQAGIARSRLTPEGLWHHYRL